MTTIVKDLKPAEGGEKGLQETINAREIREGGGKKEINDSSKSKCFSNNNES